MLGTCCPPDLHLSLTSCTQAEQLPAPKAGMRQQLGLWASQLAAVRAGDLQLRFILGAQDREDITTLSPHADWMAGPQSEAGTSVVLTPLTGMQPRPTSQQSAQPPGHTLALPAPEPERIQEVAWSSSSQHLVIVSCEGSRWSPSGVRLSTFQGTQLVGTFVEPLASSEQHIRFAGSLHLLGEAPTIFLTLFTASGSRVLASSAQGTVTARHERARTSRNTVPLEGGRILCASSAGDRLYTCSPSGTQEISLRRASSDLRATWVSCWGDLASVLLCGPAGRAYVLLLVDLTQQRVQHVLELPSPPGTCRMLPWHTQGAHAVALQAAETSKADVAIHVVAISGTTHGKELFRCPGRLPAWDALGRFLAVASKHEGMHVLDGSTGAPLASWPHHRGPSILRWLPDSGGLAAGAYAGADSLSWCIVRFAGVCKAAVPVSQLPA